MVPFQQHTQACTRRPSRRSMRDAWEASMTPRTGAPVVACAARRARAGPLADAGGSLVDR
jgi:hypothetical protein